MITKKELKEWVDKLPDDALVGVDDVSLELVGRSQGSDGWEDLLKVGLIPEAGG